MDNLAESFSLGTLSFGLQACTEVFVVLVGVSLALRSARLPVFFTANSVAVIAAILTLLSAVLGGQPFPMNLGANIGMQV